MRGSLGLCNTAQSEHQIVILEGSGLSVYKGEKEKLQHLIPGLTTSIENEKVHREDVYQAQACLGWLYWTEGPEHAASALSALPRGLPTVLDPATEKPVSLSASTYVCLVRSACLLGSYPIPVFWNIEMTGAGQVSHRMPEVQDTRPCNATKKLLSL